MRVPAKSSELLEIYVDESSQNNHRFLVLGAIVVPFEDSAKLASLILKARLPELPAQEAKWTKASKAKLATYKRIVDVIFDNPDLAHFHSLFVDTHLVNHHKFNAGDKEIGFNKEIYQLGSKVCQLYSTDYFHLYPDYRDTNQTTDELRLILNRGCKKRGDKRDWTFRRCQFRDSSTTLQLQLVDVLIGGIAYELNGHAKAADASASKVELSAYILKRAGITDITKGTLRAAKFSVWPRKLR